MNAIVGIGEALLDAIFPPRKTEVLLRHTPNELYERITHLRSRHGSDALLPYNHPCVTALIWELKYYDSHKAIDIGASAIASYIEELLAEELLEPPVLVAVPLHKTRLQERGYNQSERLAHASAKKLGRLVAYAPDLLVRTKATPRQTELPMKKRLENVRGAFTISRAPAIIGRPCILIDDVLTTGATLTSCAEVLREAGASRVFPVALAYAE